MHYYPNNESACLFDKESLQCIVSLQNNIMYLYSETKITDTALMSVPLGYRGIIYIKTKELGYKEEKKADLSFFFWSYNIMMAKLMIKIVQRCSSSSNIDFATLVAIFVHPV